MSENYIVSPFRKPRTLVIDQFPVRDLVCKCGNKDQDKFLTVTSLGGTVLKGFVCAVCEDNAMPLDSKTKSPPYGASS